MHDSVLVLNNGNRLGYFYTRLGKQFKRIPFHGQTILTTVLCILLYILGLGSDSEKDHMT